MLNRKVKQVLALILAGTMMFGNLPAADLGIQVQAEEAVEAFSVSFVDKYASVGQALAPTVTGAQDATYQWYVGGVQKGTEETYTPTESDLNKWIEVVVTSGKEVLNAKLYFSKLPVVYIDTEGGQTITSKENYIDADMRVQGNDQYQNSKELYNGKTEIRGRGNSTWAQPKKPYRLKLDKKTDMFGMGEGTKSKHWVLLANYLDESLLRNTLAYDMSGEMGMEHLSTVWVEVVMNGEHVGNYQFCENVRVDEDRVDIFDWESYCEDVAAVIEEAEGLDEDALVEYMAEESMQWITSGSFVFNGKTYKLSDYESALLELTAEDYGHELNSISELSNLITGGYILELDEYYDEVSKFKTNSNQPIMFKNPEYVYTNTDMMNYVKTYVQAFENAVQSVDYTSIYEGQEVHYSTLYDFDELIDYWLVTEIFYNEEINKKSTYMYKPVDEKMIMGPIWDMDWSSGAGGTSTGATNQWATNYFNTNAQSKQWYKSLVKDPYFVLKAQERYWEIRGVEVQQMLDNVDIHMEYLAESGNADYEVWRVKAGRGTSFASDANNLRSWLNAHVAWMDGQMETEDSIVSAFFTPSANLGLSLLDKEGNALTEDLSDAAPADAIVGLEQPVVLQISNGGNYSGTAAVYVNSKNAGTVALNAGTITFEVSADLLNETKDTKNVIEVKVKDNSGKVSAENYITVKETDCVHDKTEWQSDEEKHWKECECGKTLGMGLHSYEWSVDQEATPDQEGIKHEVCKTCSKTRNENTTFPYVEEPADPSDTSKDIPVSNMVAISESECSCSGTEGSDDYVLDGNPNTYWHTMHSTVAEGTYLEKRWVGVSLNEPMTVSGIRFLPRPAAGNGQVSEYKIQYRTTDDGEWIEVANGTWDTNDDGWKYVGFAPVTAKQVRIIGVHTVSGERVDRHMTCAEFRVTGVTSVNPPEPTPTPGPTEPSEMSPDIPLSMLTATAGDSDGSDVPENVLDENESTVWHTDWAGTPDYSNHWLQIELSAVTKVDGLRYLPRTDKSVNGMITSYEIYTSLDGVTWEKATEGTWTKDKEWQNASFTEVETKFVRLVTIDALSDSNKLFSSAAEVRLTGTVDGEVPPTESLTVAFENGYAEVSKELKVTVNSEKTLSYTWKVDGKTVSEEASYTPTEEDLEKWIEVVVSDGASSGIAKMYCSKLPVVYIDTEGGQAITSKEKYIDATIKLQGNAQYSDSKVLYEGATEIRGRGNSTWAQPKKPYRLKLDKKTDAFGMGKSKHWVLLANYLDESLMRNTLAYNLSGSMGMEQMSTVWVDVIMNGQYVGNYQFCENIRVDDTRVDIFDWEGFAEEVAIIISEAETMDEDTADDLITYMAEESMQWITSGSFTFNGKAYHLADYEEGILTLLSEDFGYDLGSVEELTTLITGGYIIELDEYYDEVSKFKTNSGQPIMFKNPEFVGTNSDMMAYVRTYIQAFEDAVKSSDYTAKYDGDDLHYSKLYDFDALVDYWLISEIFFNEELNKKSTYMYKEVDELMKMGPIWDMDWSSSGEGDTKHTNRWATLHFGVNAQARQWYKDLVKDPYFLVRAQERYWEIRDLQVQDMLDVMDDNYEYLKESGAADGVAWGKGDKSFGNDYTKLNTWLNTHVAWLDAQMATEDALVSSFLSQTQSLSLSLTDEYGAAFEKDTAEKAPADAIAPNAAIALEIKGVTGTAKVFVNGMLGTTLSVEAAGSIAWITPAMLTAEETDKNVIEVKVYDGSNAVIAENFVTVKVEGKVVVDKTALQAKVDEAVAMDVTGYTEETVAVFVEALENAESVLQNDEASQEDVDAAVAALTTAMEGLEEIPTVSVTEIFSDVKAGKWYVDAVQYVYDNGLMSGNDGLFNPTGNVTRAQVVTTLYRLAGSPEVTDFSACDVFSDVVSGKYYTNAVCWAYNTGVGTGNNGKFDISGFLTRQQLAAFLFRFAGHVGADVETRADYSTMLNANKVSSYAKEAVSWAVGAGLISGSEIKNADGSISYDLNPLGNTSRAQLATILQRFCTSNNL